ncbi:MAG TPA: cytochrome b/b6 domain-containing protein [Candidatus Limnocylindrales bacterium]|nr:cytochrome b/b6 domain-containing protein [Candidatus Limnocylindrales bacterium]
MKRSLTLLLIALLCFAGAVAAVAQQSPMHPTFPLLDSGGRNVLETGAPISTLMTCGACHNAEFITSHTLHGDGGRLTAGVLPPEQQLATGVEMNCFLCHSVAPNNAARIVALTSGSELWANTATLLDTGIVAAGDDGAFTYNADAFAEDGALRPEFIALQDPKSDNCGTCHGQVHLDNQTPLDLAVCDSSQWRTFTTGQVVSPQRISRSGANLSDREAVTRPWDVHAERVLNCVDCHFSANSPVYALEDPAAQPDHLTFDPRRADIGEYLQRPSHIFASGSTSMRTCESCHNAEVSHTWLPYWDRHSKQLACESCHVPQVYAPALAYRDATVVRADGSFIDACRGIGGGIAAPPEDPAATLLTGYQPVLLQQTDVSGEQSLSPYNLVTVWTWVYGPDALPVPEAEVRAAYLDGDRYAPEVQAAFDADGDGALSDGELSLDSDAKTALITQRLAALGFENAQVRGEVLPFALHHGVIGGEWATRDCQSCHSEDSRIVAGLPLSDRTPGGVTPVLASNARVAWNGELTADDTGTFSFQPETQTAAATLYLFGRDSVALVDTLGVLIVLGVAAGVTIHATLRVISGRRRKNHAPAPVQREYMYGIYERQWHWLQTAVIFGLVFTGMVVHRPQMFSAFNFAWMVDLHNLFALLLVLNAVLALFYHLASGEIKQFIPRPYGFFDKAFEQALFYLKGIFRGDPHPFEKTRESKLNPLQQITYFGLLNVLLPLIMLTGILMWGAQRWPQITSSIGGLALIAPIHTLVAWLIVAFIIAHVYLTTTGHTPLAGMRAMVMGYDDVEQPAPSAEPSASDAG